MSANTTTSFKLLKLPAAKRVPLGCLGLFILMLIYANFVIRSNASFTDPVPLGMIIGYVVVTVGLAAYNLKFNVLNCTLTESRFSKQIQIGEKTISIPTNTPLYFYKHHGGVKRAVYVHYFVVAFLQTSEGLIELNESLVKLKPDDKENIASIESKLLPAPENQTNILACYESYSNQKNFKLLFPKEWAERGWV